MSWAAEIDERGIVLRVIVGEADWATEVLGGQWIACNKYSETEKFPGIGWSYIDGQWVEPVLEQE